MSRPTNHPFLRLRALLLAAGVGAVCVGNPCLAAEKQDGVALTARGGAHPAFDRLVFDGPRGVGYEVHRAGDHVTVRFSLPATVGLREVATAPLTRLRDVVAQQNEVRFTIAPSAIVKSFANGASYVIDIYGKTVPESAPIPTQETPAVPKKDAGAVTAPPPPPKEVKPVVAPPTLVAPTIAAPSLAPTPKAAPQVPVVSSPLPAVPVAVATLPPLSGDAPQLVATLDPKVSVGAAVYARAGYGYIFFDRKLTLGLAALLPTGTTPHVRLEPLELPNNTAYRFAIPAGTNLRAVHAGTAWQLLLDTKLGQVAVATELLPQPDFAFGARLMLPLGDAPDPIRFTDPVVGDELVVVPLRENLAFGLKRRWAEISLLTTAQGLVVKPLHEKVVVRALAEGVEITAQGGLRLSPLLDTGVTPQMVKKTKDAQSDDVVFAFINWYGKPNENFTDARRRLTQTIVDVPEAERNHARLDLARFYFAHGMGDESLAILSFLNQQMPGIAARTEFLALRGAANILASHPTEGLQDLSDPALARQPEIQLWEAVAASQLRDWPTAEEKFALTENLLSAYPEPFFSRFSVLAIEAALAIDKDHEAADWLDRLETQPHASEVDPALHYLRGVLYGKAGRADMAGNLWREVAKSHNRLYKTRAEMALVDLGVATHSLTPQQAAERLEGLRFAWRGDDLELDILHRLGGFYIDAHKFRDGLSVLRQAGHLYPDSPLVPIIHGEMAKTFRDIFIGTAAPDMSPVDALTIYQDFHDLMPSGADGDALGRNLAERLVAVDLLDQASAILEDQVKNRLQGEIKAKTGTRLAAIRLLDHKTDAAMAALDLSQSDKMPGDMQSERQLLRARALSEQNKPDEALALLQNNTSLPAKALRADITTRAQRWGDAAKALLDLVGPPPEAGQLLSADQAQEVVQAAIALSLAGDGTGIDKLAIDFGAAMAAMPQNDTFRVLTRPEKGGQMANIAAAQAKIAEVDLFHGFLDAYRTAAPSEDKAKP